MLLPPLIDPGCVSLNEWQETRTRPDQVWEREVLSRTRVSETVEEVPSDCLEVLDAVYVIGPGPPPATRVAVSVVGRDRDAVLKTCADLEGGKPEVPEQRE